MAQPVSSNIYTAINAIGTAVVSNESACVERVVFPGTYVGTVKLHDAPSAAGTNTNYHWYL